VLNEGAPAFVRMIEDAQPALAPSNIVLIPGSFEQRTLAAKRLDKAAYAPVPKVARVVGAELAEDVAGAILPPGISLRADDSRNTNRKRFRWLSPSNQTRKSRDAALFQQQASHKRSRP
jgi:hypothetical protein